jgi:GDP-L-fucose synthase
LNLLDGDAVREFLSANWFDVVVHSATVRSNRKMPAPAALFQQNCRMFFNLARNNGLYGKVIYFGSGAEYDSRHYQPKMREEYFDTHVPADDYGFSKYVCAKSLAATPNIYELRLFAVFGPYEDWQVRFLSNACCRAVWDLPIVIRQNVVFDFLDVADVARVVEWFAVNTPRQQHFNVCSGRALDLKTLAAMVVTASGKQLDILVKREGLGAEYSGDNTRLLAEMGDFAFRGMDVSIKELYRWYEDRKANVDPTMLHFDA